jgi:hypothetical protein
LPQIVAGINGRGGKEVNTITLGLG